ncbi:MAG: arginyl-tRNA synthetase [Microbacteriaceae bacterium]
MHSRRRVIVSALIAPVALGLALAVVGCSPQPEPQPTATTEPTASATPDPETTDQPDAGGALDVPCSGLVSDAAMYEFSPNYGLDDSWTPAASSLAHKAVSLGGTACAWRNETGGELIVVAAAHPDAATYDALRAKAGVSNSDTRAFSVTGDTGTAQSFEKGIWITAVSSEFLELVDAAPLLKAANAQVR